MQYRGFIQFLLLLLATGCFVLGLYTSLLTLIALAFTVEIIVWTRILAVPDNQMNQG